VRVNYQATHFRVGQQYFLLCDAMHKRGLCCRAACLSVCLSSVCHVRVLRWNE